MSNCRKTQKQLVLSHMRQFGFITTLTAAKRYDICRLSERIRELEEDGHHINKPRTTRNGKTYSVYSLVEWKQARAA
jgi:hypothetical protein